MSLFEQMQQAKSEEDVRDAYIKAMDATSAHRGTHFVSFKIETHEVAKYLAEKEYEKYRIVQDKNYISDFDKEVVKKLKTIDKERLQ